MSRWILEGRGPTGKVVFRKLGSGAPTVQFEWDGQPVGGGPQAPGEYRARLEVMQASGGRGWSPEVPFVIEPPPEPKKPAKRKKKAKDPFPTFSRSGNLFTQEGDPLPRLKNGLKRRIRDMRRLDRPILIEVHTTKGTDAEFLKRLSQTQAEGLRAWLVSEGAPSKRLTAVGKGATEPAVGDGSAKANRRVVVRLGKEPEPKPEPEEKPPPPPPERPEVRVSGLPVEVGPDGRFSTRVDGTPGGAILIDVRLPDGRRSLLVHRMPAAAARKPAPPPPAQPGAPSPLGLPLPPAPALGAPPAPPAQPLLLPPPPTGAPPAPPAQPLLLPPPPPQDALPFAPPAPAAPPAAMPGLPPPPPDAQPLLPVAPEADAPEAPAVDPLAQPPGGGSGGDLPIVLAQASMDFPEAPAAPAAPAAPTPATPAAKPAASPVPVPAPAPGPGVAVPPPPPLPLAPPPASAGAAQPAASPVAAPSPSGLPAAPKGVQVIPAPRPLAGPDAEGARSPTAEPRHPFAGFGTERLMPALQPLEAERRRRLAAAAANQLELRLPPAGTELSEPRLRIRGKTAKDNRLFLNGQPVALNEDGSFDHTLDLPTGDSVLEAKVVDAEGNTGFIRRPIRVKETVHFLLAVADGMVGDVAAQLDEVTDQTSPDLGDVPVFLHGRAALYYKGRIEGGKLFEQYLVTAHLDTAKRREFGELFSRIVDPDKTYAVYGDSSTEVADVRARGKLYVHVEADRSTLTVGSFPVDMEGVEFFRYDRVVDGGKLRFVKEWEPGWETEVRAFGTIDDDRVRPGHDELRGTGGSLFYLQHDAVVTGSEQVRLVVRDRDTGMVLKEVPQTRDVDYTIHYENGRILFKSPVSTAIESALLGGGLWPDRDVMAGHTVWVVVDYEHWDRGAFGGDGAGVHVRQSLGGLLRLGGGYLMEGHVGDEDYALWSVEALATPHAGVEVDAEYARSESAAGLGQQSDDGGLTWRDWSLRDLAAPRATGRAYVVRARGDVAKMMGKDGRLVDLQAYLRHQDPGFYSYGSMLEQGTSKYGLHALWHADRRNQVYLAHDGGLMDLADLDAGPDVRPAKLDHTTVRYTHRGKGWQALAEYAHLFWDESTRPEGDSIHSNVVAGGGTYELDRGISLSLRQDLIIDGDDVLLAESGDHLATTASLAIQVAEDLHLTLTERLRWTGENATAIGFRTRMDDGTDVYVQERLWSLGDLEPRDSATVVGASRTSGPNGAQRTFAEYQLAGAGSAARNRALIGIGRRFRVLPGLTLDAGYERMQISAALQGDSSQDAVSAGFEWLAHEDVRLSARAEGRVADRDERYGLDDLMQVLAVVGAEARLPYDMTVLGRLRYSETRDQTLDRIDARLLESAVGMAYRPKHNDWFHFLVRWSKQVDRRPGALLDGEVHETHSDVVSATPVIDTPYRVQLVNKIAYRVLRDRTADMPEATSESLLTLHRVNYRILDELDAGVEYRFLNQRVADDLLHGVLVEASYILQDVVRVGLGYNFTSFTDYEFPSRDVDRSGVFFRVTGQY